MKRWAWIGVLLSAGVPRVWAECICPPAKAQEQRDLATYVFNGDVWDVTKDKATGKNVITFDVNDTFKGKPAERIELTDSEAATDCRTDFKEGETYLVYVRWLWGAYLTSRCWGTKRLEQASSEGAVLGPGDVWKGKLYGKLQELCMGRRDTPCCLSSLSAMREGSYLPQPEEGCPDGTIPDRLRCDGSYLWCVPATEEHRHQ